MGDYFLLSGKKKVADFAAHMEVLIITPSQPWENFFFPKHGNKVYSSR